MCRIFFQIIIILTANIIFFSTSYPQTNEQEKIKQGFLQIVRAELKSLQDWGLSSKDQPERTLVFHQVPDNLKRLSQSFKKLGVQNQKDDYLYENKWKAYYSEWSDEFTYDIIKTNSIVSPYYGIVKFYGKIYYKEGKTKEECLSSPWKVKTSNVDGKPLIYQPTLKYSFQNGKWVLTESPPAYKKY